MSKGKFITIEGIDGVGKSTLVPQIERALQNRNIQTLVTREPGGTSIAESIRTILLEDWEESFTPAAELLLMFAARSQHVAEIIAPALESGVWVICERFTDATYAYQGGGRTIPDEFIDKLAELVHGNHWPDLTLYLDIDVERARKRRGHLIADRIEKESLEFFRGARLRYQQLAKNHPRIKLVDANHTAAQVATVSMGHISQLFIDQEFK